LIVDHGKVVGELIGTNRGHRQSIRGVVVLLRVIEELHGLLHGNVHSLLLFLKRYNRLLIDGYGNSNRGRNYGSSYLLGHATRGVTSLLGAAADEALTTSTAAQSTASARAKEERERSNADTDDGTMRKVVVTNTSARLGVHDTLGILLVVFAKTVRVFARWLIEDRAKLFGGATIHRGDGNGDRTFIDNDAVQSSQMSAKFSVGFRASEMNDRGAGLAVVAHFTVAVSEFGTIVNFGPLNGAYVTKANSLVLGCNLTKSRVLGARRMADTSARVVVEN